MKLRLDQPPDQQSSGSLSFPAAIGASEREFGLEITREGAWLYRGSPIHRLALVKLLASVLRREADGSYWLVTPVERGRIAVADVPFVAVELAVEGAGTGQRLRLRSNLDEWVTLGPARPLRLRRTASGPDETALVPYVEVRAGLEARLARPVFYQLVDLGEERREGGRSRFGVWSEGCFFALDDDA